MKECCICLDATVLCNLLALLPCMHRCVCAGCSELLLAEPPHARKCPKCRGHVTRAARVYED
jgi:hypothetical protein